MGRGFKGWFIACFLLPFTVGFGEDLKASEFPNKSGFFFGLGASYSSVQLDLYVTNASGTSNVFTSGSLVAFGEAGGSANPYHHTESLFNPAAQFGYFDHFPCSEWLWGAEFLYKYIGCTFSYGPFESFQAGEFTSLTSDTFYGNEIIGSLQTQVTHDIGLLLFLGRSFMKNTVYLGAGPALIGTSSNIYNAFGFADINGIHADITGTPINFSSSQWMWGGMAQLGMTHYFSPSWFLDLNYNYTVTAYASNSYAGPFTGSTTSGGDVYVTRGTFFIDDYQRFTIQSFTVTINKAF